MDGLRHSSTMSPTDSHSPAVSTHTLDTSDNDDSGSTPRHNAPSLSSSLPRTGRMSPRQSVSGLAVPQLSGLIRRGSRADDVEDEAEEVDAHKSSTDMIVRWREQDEERQREEDRRSGQAKQRRHATQRRKASPSGGQQDDDDDEEIFQLDTTSTEDSWSGEGAEQEDDDEEEEIEHAGGEGKAGSRECWR